MKKNKILLITGELMPMHDYRRVNDILRTFLEASGYFEVTITEEAHGITAKTLAPYDMVLVNYDGLNEGVTRGGNGRSIPASGSTKGSGFKYDVYVPLGEPTTQSLLDFVAGGKGVFFFHTAACGNSDLYSDEYNALLGSRYGDKTLKPYRDPGYNVVTHHESGHPVTEGVADVWRIADDDFLNGATLCEGTTLIASIYDPVNENEAPVMWCKEYGKGRSFTCALGHQEDTLRRLDFCRLLIHACDWLCNNSTELALPDRESGHNGWKSWPWYYCDHCDYLRRPLEPISYY